MPDSLDEIRAKAKAITQSPLMRTAEEITTTFLKAIAFILPHEEDFARGHWGDENFVVAENVSGDSGGWTKYGIDASSHPGLDIKNLTRDQAVQIYWSEWLKYNIDKLPEKIAIAQFDVRVNGGQAVKWLQNAINHVGFSTPQSELKLPIAVDGAMGPTTIACAWACDETLLVRYFIAARDARFRMIATGPRAKFLDGWLQRDVDLKKFLAV